MIAMNAQIENMKVNLQSYLYAQCSPSNPQGGSAIGGLPPIQFITLFILRVCIGKNFKLETSQIKLNQQIFVNYR